MPESRIYRMNNAISKIDGYYIPNPNEKPEATFMRARAECIKQLEKQLEDIRNIPFSLFQASKSTGGP